MTSFAARSLLLATAALASLVASAQTFTLTDGGALARINATTGTMDDFEVGGTDHVFAHTYYLRNGDAGTGIGLGAFTLDSASQPATNFLQLVYSNATFRIQVRYLLTGAISQGDMAESIVVTNISGQAASLRLFQYADWDMAGTSANDTVTRTNSSTMTQTDGVMTASMGIHGGTPIPDFTELGVFPSIRNDITTTNGYFLDTAIGNGIGDSFTGDATYAYQWNRNLSAGAQFSLSTDKVLAVPEPASMFALGLGGAALLARMRRRKKA